MCRSGLHTSEVLHVYGGKKFTFSLSENIELPTSLDVFLSLFLPIACVLFVFGRSSPETLDDVSPTWSKFPRITHIRKRMFSFIFMTLTRVVVLYTSLRLVEGVYKPQRACVGWWMSQCDRIVSRSVHVNQTYLFLDKGFPHATLFEEEAIYPAKFRKKSS